jgi:hypothetical protein
LNNGTHRYYECGHQKYNGKESCEGTTVREDVLLKSLGDFLEEWLGEDQGGIGTAAFYGALNPDNLPEAFAEIRKLLVPPAKTKKDRERLEKEIEQVSAKLTKARENLVLLDPANIPAAQNRIRQFDEQLRQLKNELVESKPPTEQDINKVVLDVCYTLSQLSYACRVLAQPAVYDKRGNRGIDHGDGTVTWGSLESAAPRMVKQLLNHASYIVCHTERKGYGKGTRHVFTGGEIVFSVGGIPSNLNPHHLGKSQGCCR